MLRFKQAQRALVADRLSNAANLAMGALVLGQFLADRFSPLVALLGLVLWTSLMIWSAVLAGGVEG